MKCTQLNGLQEENSELHQVLKPLENMAYSREIALEDLVSTIAVEISELQQSRVEQARVNEEQGQLITELQRGIADQGRLIAELQSGMADQVSITRSFQIALERLMPLP